MVNPTLYQRLIIEKAGYDPDTWWPVEWGEKSAVLKNRATQEIVTLDDIEGYCEDNICRNIAGDEDDPTHYYEPQITVNYGGPRE